MSLRVKRIGTDKEDQGNDFIEEQFENEPETKDGDSNAADD